MPAFRQILVANLEPGRIRPERLVGKYVPNLVARPFEIEKGFFEEVRRLTGSKVLGEWEGWERMIRAEKEGSGRGVVEVV